MKCEEGIRRRKVSGSDEGRRDEGEEERKGGRIRNGALANGIPPGSHNAGTVQVVKLSSVVWLCIGMALGSAFGGPWLQDLVDKIYGYRWNYLDRCILETPDEDGYGVDFCRHPANCQDCAKVTQIEEIHVDDLTVDMFEERYAYSNQPLIVRNAALHWEAMQVMDYYWIKERYLRDPGTVDKTGDDCWFNKYKTFEFQNLRAVFKLPERRVNMESGKPWYVGWSVCHEEVAQEIYNITQRPSFISPESTPPSKPWIFIGTPGPGAHMHVDNVDMSSWQVQIRGSKTWYLKPPPECWLTCGGTIIQGTLYPGDILVVNTNFWFHSTKVHGPGLNLGMVNEYD